MLDVKLESAAHKRETVQNLFQFYSHDFSDFFDVRRVEFQENGRFPLYGPLAAYWSEPGAEPYLIRADGNIAGFVLIDRHSHSGRPCDYNMGEFFVARHYRREGVGRTAAKLAIEERPGLWEIAIARNNVPAKSFWRGVVGKLARGPVQEVDQDDDRWNGLILRFVAT